MKRAVLSYAIKFALSAGALWLAFSSVDLAQIWLFIKQLNPAYVILALACLHGSHFFGAMRLRDYLKVQNRDVSRRYVWWLHYVGTMFNMLLPSSIGGDGYKAWLLSKRYGCKLLAMLHIMLSGRANGLLVLFALLAALLLAHDGLRAAIPYYNALVIAGVALVAVVYSLAAKWLWKEPLALQARMAVFSLGVQGMMLLSVYVLLLAFNAPNQLDYLIIMLVSSIVSLLPISIGGIGLREILLLYAAPYMSLELAQAVSFGAVYSLMHLSVSLVGVVAYVVGHKGKERR